MKELSKHDFNRIIITRPKACWPRELAKFCNHELNCGYINRHQFDHLIKMLANEADRDIYNSIITQMTSIFFYYNCVNWEWVDEYIDLNLFKYDMYITKIAGHQWHRNNVAKEWVAQ